MADYLRVEIPAELGESEVIAQFLAYPRGAVIDANSGELKLSLGVPNDSKYAAMPVTDRAGETFHVLVIGRVRPIAPFPNQPNEELPNE